MPRPLPPVRSTVITDTVTKPGYLIEIGFATPLRGCSRGAVTVEGLVFPGRGFDVRWSQNGGSAETSININFDDLDFTVATLILGETIANKVVRVWSLYGDPTTSGGTLDAREAVLIFEGLGDDANIDPESGRVTVSAYMEGSATIYAPRIYMTAENGFNHLPPANSQISWGGEVYVFNPEV